MSSAIVRAVLAAAVVCVTAGVVAGADDVDGDGNQELRSPCGRRQHARRPVAGRHERADSPR